MYAHRGAHLDGAPENTIAAFERAASLGAGAIEFDVRRSADDQLVVFHDAKLGRTPLDSLTAAEISARAGFEVPRLSDVLRWAGDRIVLDVELKEDGYVERVLEPLTDFEAAGGRLLVTSFIDRVLARVGQVAPGTRRGLLIGMTAIGAVARTRACGASTLVVQAKLASDRLLDEAGAGGLSVIVWDVLKTVESKLMMLPARLVLASAWPIT